MKRSGQSVSQMSGYKAFIPSPFPPNPPIQIDDSMNQLLSEANIALGRLDTMGYLLAMGELELYMHNANKLPILITCALIHYQFETIHPFLDGNGRIGRLLITFYLCWKQVMQKPLLYLSYYFKLHRQEYYDRLNLVREKGDYEQWINFFLKGIVWTSESALATIKQVLALADTHKKKLIGDKISSPTVIGLLDYLFVKPHISIQDVMEHLQMTFQTAQKLINHFVEIEILREITGKKRDRRYSYWQYLEYLSEGTNL